jgi:hypothetical protein
VLVELNLVEQRYQAVLEVLNDGATVTDVVFHLESALLAAQLHQLGLFGGGDAVADAVIDVGLAHPPTHRLHRDVEVGRDLGDRQITATSNRDHVTLELRRELLGHRNILAARPRRA